MFFYLWKKNTHPFHFLWSIDFLILHTFSPLRSWLTFFGEERRKYNSKKIMKCSFFIIWSEFLIPELQKKSKFQLSLSEKNKQNSEQQFYCFKVNFKTLRFFEPIVLAPFLPKKSKSASEWGKSVKNQEIYWP